MMTNALATPAAKRIAISGYNCVVAAIPAVVAVLTASAASSQCRGRAAKMGRPTTSAPSI